MEHQVFVTKALSEVCRSEEELLQRIERDLPGIGRQLGFEADKLDKEVRVGNFLSDRLVKCKDGSIIVIEAQLGESNHDHLGKLFTYVAGIGADKGYLICEVARPEHLEAIKVFGQGRLQIFEAYGSNGYLILTQMAKKTYGGPKKIGNHDWTRGIQYKEFWIGFKEYGLTHGIEELRNRNPRKDSAGFSIPLGFLGITYNFGISMSESFVGLDTNQVEKARPTFEAYRSRIEGAEWVDIKGVISFRWRQGAGGNIRHPEDWPSIYESLVGLYLRAKESSKEFLDYVQRTQNGHT